jgi:hypothetical protein
MPTLKTRRDIALQSTVTESFDAGDFAVAGRLLVGSTGVDRLVATSDDNW